MLYIRVSPYRLFIINEYWLLIPSILLIDYLIIIKVRKSRDKKNIKTKKNYQTKLKQLKIFHSAMNNLIDILRIRAGQQLIDVIYPNCIVGEGFNYINNDRIRKLVYSLYKSKEINGVIYITKTALCYLIKRYGLALPAFSVPIEDFIGLTSWYQLIRKTAVTTLLGIAVPLFILAETPIFAILGLLTGIAGISLSFYNRDFNIVSTSLISGSFESIKRRIPDIPEVVSVYIETEPTNKIGMAQKPYECLLAEQRFTNPKCTVTTTEIVEIANNIELDYNHVVNMKDVTGLDTVEFTDIFQVPKPIRPKPRFRLRGTKATNVNFLEKFGDPQNVLENETWDIGTNSFEGIGKKNPDEFVK